MKYEKDYLTNTIVRCDYASILNIENSSSKFIDCCKKYFPTDDTPAGAPGLRYKTKDEKGLGYVTLNPNFIALEYMQYPGYKEMKERFIEFLNIISETNNNATIKRIGFRYIDQIKISNSRTKQITDWGKYWGKYISSDLTRCLSFLNTPMTRCMTKMELNYGDFQQTFQYGIFNEDYPAPNKKCTYILDTDTYVNELVRKDEVPGYLDKFHQESINVFERSIKESLRKV
ncbi:MAG: TIGR04255 family protein, partial [Bacilli bacterium]|nr:TIGR04255 family protein [Bacilli bacterium]